MPRLTRLLLQDFRNYADLLWIPDASPAGRVTVLTGPNGSGKTNLLEALSLLVPGRGLRGARTAEFARRHAGATAPSWAVAARFDSPDGPLDIGTGVQAGAAQPDRREFRLNGDTARSQTLIAARLAVVWLTPQMDALFLEPASGRRRFLDRLVFALEPDHARQIAAHDSAQSQRARLLAAGNADPAWLAGLEDSVARHAVAATAARVGLVSRLNAALAEGAAAGFPPARMALRCAIAENLAAGSALTTEEWLRAALHDARAKDAQTGAASWGAQRTDMVLHDADTGRGAELASTGQQKALMIGVILGHAALIARLRGEAPMLLLDEPLVHLDRERRELLCAAVLRLPGNILLTGTDAEGFAPLVGKASFSVTKDGSLNPETDA